MFPKNTLAQVVISAVAQFDIDTVVISPGSRNAPLTIGFTNHPKINALSIVDERCAAFFALGIAQQTQKPVAIVCTSGSALLNYYPAIAEAFYSNIPLIVISSDRPKHLIDVGDGQTIRQENVFENHILFSANLSGVQPDKNQHKEVKLITEALQIAILKKGPVHINVPFDEPLYETIDTIDALLIREIKHSILINEYNISSGCGNSKSLEKDFDRFSQIWNSSSKKLILIGVNFPSKNLEEILQYFTDDASVLLMTETTSNICDFSFINNIDQLIFSLNEEQFLELQPDLLISLGGMVISKKIKQFLRKYKPKHHWHVDEYTKLDSYQCLTEYVQISPLLFMLQMSSKNRKVISSYKNYWLFEKGERKRNHKQILAKTKYSDLKVFEQVLTSIPNNCNLQLSNSSTVRYSQLFDINKTLNVFCNRGTSGIDGSTSTAIGAAFSRKNQTVFITGDLSFFYDSNALWNNYIPANFRIIIVNNSGGGIFRFIPGPQKTNATDYFETPHNLTAEHLAKTYNFAYKSVNDLESLEIALIHFYDESSQPKILEIFTPKEINDVVLKNYFKNV